MLLCHVVTRCSQAARTSCKVTPDALLSLQFCLPTRQVSGRRASPLPIQCLLSLLLCGLVLFLSLRLFPVAPSIFPLSQFYPTIPVLFRVSGGFVSESCSLVLSGTYSLTPARSLSACVSRPFTPTHTRQNRHQHRQIIFSCIPEYKLSTLFRLNPRHHSLTSDVFPVCLISFMQFTSYKKRLQPTFFKQMRSINNLKII